MLVSGPDVSAYQGFRINWKAVAADGASFAATKISEGSGLFDETSAVNWPAMKEAGLVRIGYHFARADIAGNSPQREAQFFLDHIPELEPSDLIALDMEVPTAGNGDYSQWALTWLAMVEKATGVRPLLYTGQWYAAGLGRLGHAELGKYVLWTAAYVPTWDQSKPPPAPPPYSPWARVGLWQHTDAGSWAGIGFCDSSVFLGGSLDDLKKLGKPAPLKPAPPPPPSSLPHWRVTTPTHFRPRPQLDAMPLGPLLPAGTFVAEVPPPRGLPGVTAHWKYCRTGGDVRGYIYAPDVSPDKG